MKCDKRSLRVGITQAHRKLGKGAGGLRTPNKLLKSSIKNAISIDVMQVKKLNIFHGKTLISRHLWLSSIAHFQKMGRFPTI